MIEFITNNKRDSVILFVHGFTGGKETWKHDKHGYFFEQLLQSTFVNDHFDVAVFEYFTRLSDLYADATTVIGTVLSLFKSSKHKAKKNIGIEEISNLLRTRIRFDLAAYRNIVVIAHSMGGLVTKSCILKDLRGGECSRIKLLISLAVPHLGANLATYGKLMLSNQQIHDLAPLSELCTQMNDEWVKYQDKPAIKYFYGAYDSVVTKESAMGTDNIPQDVIACDDTHLDISKPAGASSVAITATRHFLEEFVAQKVLQVGLKAKQLDSPDQYNDETFVLKLVLADVHSATIRHSKEYFLNAEYARKLFSSAADQERLAQLYERVRILYQGCFGRFVVSGKADSTLLVTEIHDKIVAEDGTYLQTALPIIHGLHKMGMLHQLANELDGDIWWGVEQSIPALEALKAALEAKA
ncbi:conserved hypothetical protein [Cupriavidus taiwanensis]|uniref:ABC-three component system protein n=1 Tax=Cupriavidus taiwanensis TaxID=164546 RepID=UPI000E1A6666|nr:ABC-three component system protein [Cupriavidus taiwanensis]SOY94514.1 conserved hypothetical protein [Cupriavidus taiwanensis]SOY98563.1 conserved hypothetical protein [Cupriavidus taiwanensis]